jgi:hypothetical protein
VTPASTITAPAAPAEPVLGTLLAALAPLFAMLASASAFPPPADGARAIDAALALAPAEPPGYPLAALALRACTLLPLGPLALRAALGSALLHALAAAALYRAIDASLRAGAGLRPLVASPLALGLSALAFGSAPLFADGARTHAAAVALCCLCLERWVAFERARPRLLLAPLRSAGLLWGLLSAEQPALAACLLIAALPGLRRALGEFRLPAENLAPLALGLPLWLFAPLARAPELGLAHASSPLAMLQAAFALGRETQRWPTQLPPTALAPVALGVLGFAGALIALRSPALRRFGALWLGAGLSALAGGIGLEEAAPCWALALCAAAALSAFALAPLLAGQAKGRLAPALAVALVALALTQLQAVARAALALDRAAGDALSDALRRDLPARGALLLAPELAAGFLDAEHEERARPDLLVALQPWLLDLPAAERVAERSPELMPLMRAQLLAQERPERAGERRGAPRALPERELPLVELTALAARRPVLLELQSEPDPGLYKVLVPHALYHQVSTHAVGKSDIDLAAREAARRLARLDAQLDLSRLDRATTRLLAERFAAELAYAQAIAAPAVADRARAALDRLGVDPSQLPRPAAAPAP